MTGNVEYTFEKGKGWIPRLIPQSSRCWWCGSESIYCCEASPFYDTTDYWIEQGRLLVETR